MVASKIVSAVDDSTIPHAWGSIDIDDEGNPGEKRVLIKNGILKDFMVDDFNGRRMNRNGNGACRRQNYRYVPTSRMSNTYICPGKSTPEEIIKATKLGLYLVSFGGGQVDPSTGEFNFGASEAYIVRDGKVCEMVKGATLIGKGYEILKKSRLPVEVLNAVLMHHERCDGTGYPLGLPGPKINKYAKVVAIADVYDALVSKRCYKDPFTKSKAFEMITSGECGQFSPKLIDCFERRIADFEEIADKQMEAAL